MPLNNLPDIYQEASEPFDSIRAGHIAGLRAVEAAVRADQIEKDAGIAENTPADSRDFEGYPRWPNPRVVAAAIRAQLNGDSNAE